MSNRPRFTEAQLQQLQAKQPTVDSDTSKATKPRKKSNTGTCTRGELNWHRKAVMVWDAKGIWWRYPKWRPVAKRHLLRVK
jgi:hypothetical protein